MATKKTDPLEELRKQVRELIYQNYKSIDDFCLNSSGVPKSTISRLLSGERAEFRFDTLQKIAKGLDKKLTIRLD
jgi:predicted transcriptional regulator